MRAGKLRTLITIEQRTNSPDGMGGVTTSWTEFCKSWGRQIIRRAESDGIASGLQSVLGTKWEIRFVTGVSPKMRIKVEDRILDIEAVYDPSQKRERLELICVEHQNEGSASQT